MRHSIRLAATALLTLSLIAADSLEAQRRTSGGSGGSSSGGSGSGGSSGGSTSRGGGGGGGSSGGSRDRGGSGGTATSRPASAPAARGSGGRSEPAAAATPRDREGGTSTAARPDASSTGGSRGRTGTSTASGRTTDSEGRATTGKIGAVRRSADNSRRRGGKVLVGGPVYVGGCYSCDYWGWYGGRWGWYGGGWWYPEPYYPGGGGHAGRGYDDDEDADERGDGYLDYPYEANDEGDTFARSRSRGQRSFGTLSAQYFSDVASDVSAGRIGFEGVSGRFRLDLDYAHYAEPVTGGTDRMQTFRAGVGFQPRLGNNAFAIVGIGGRGVWLNQGGGSAGGPEGTLGIQVLPFKPFGFNVTGRVAGMRWSSSSEDFAMAEMNTTGSVFLGRAEIQAGWHWLKLEGAPAFGGPIVGVKMWF